MNSEPVTHLQWCFFAKIVYSFKPFTILARSSILRFVTGYWICLGYFFRFTFIIYFFSAPNILNINGTATLHTNVCLTTGIPQQCLSCRLDVLFNFGQIFAPFSWYFCCWLWILFVYCECYLMTYLCGKPKRGYVYGGSCKTLVSICADD